MFQLSRNLSPVQALARRWLSSDASRSSSPILYHYFEKPLTYHKGLALQEALVSRRSAAKTALQSHEDGTGLLSPEELERHTALTKEDVILLLQHEPVYTTGRRDTDPEVLKVEKERLTAIGAEYIATQRGGQTTYHGPGQLVGYPIVDTSLMNMSTRQYVEAIASCLEKLVMNRYEIPLQIPPPHVGIYPSSTTKIASIGIQIRHRITSHGFALNVTDDVKYWFDQIIACGAPDIKATSIESELRKLGKAPARRYEVEDVVPKTIAQLEETFQREIKPVKEVAHPELYHILTQAVA